LAGNQRKLHNHIQTLEFIYYENVNKKLLTDLTEIYLDKQNHSVMHVFVLLLWIENPSNA